MRTRPRKDLLLLAVLLPLACRDPEPAPSTDPRTPLALPAEAADGVRAEMRTMLASLHAILTAMPARDTAAIRQAARASGMGAAADTALEALLPERFLALGLATHQGFDSLAAARDLHADSVAARLARITTSCVACHAQYRLGPP